MNRLTIFVFFFVSAYTELFPKSLLATKTRVKLANSFIQVSIICSHIISVLKERDRRKISSILTVCSMI